MFARGLRIVCVVLASAVAGVDAVAGVPLNDGSGLVTGCGPEVLPAFAFANRTVWPRLVDYSGPRGAPLLALGLVSDVQYADQCEKQRRHFNLSLPKLRHVVREFNANRTHLDLVLHLGDLVDHSLALFLPRLRPVLQELRAPLFQVLGNHDFLGTAESNFGTLPALLGMPSRYYSVAAGPGAMFRLVVLDGNDVALYSTAAGSPGRAEADGWVKSLRRSRAKNGNRFNGAMGRQQQRWLQQELTAACASGQRAVVVIHHSLRPKDELTNLWNDFVVVPIITEHRCVVAVLNGHAHKYMDDFRHSQQHGVHFITFGGLVQSPFTSFGFADFYADELHIHGLIFGRPIDFRYPLRPHLPPPRRGDRGPPRLVSTAESQSPATAAGLQPTAGFGREEGPQPTRGPVPAPPLLDAVGQLQLGAVAVGVALLYLRRRRLRL